MNRGEGMEYTFEDIEYLLDRKNLVCVLVKCKSVSTTIIIPQDVAGCTVMGIYDKAFCGNDTLVELYIPDTVQKIGKHAFENCSRLITVDLYNSSIKNKKDSFIVASQAFASCYALKEFNAKYKLLRVGEEAFKNCYKLLFINGLIQELKENGFQMCESLNTLHFANNANLQYLNLLELDKLESIQFGRTAQLTPKLIQAISDNNITIHCQQSSELSELSYMGCKIVTIDEGDS